MRYVHLLEQNYRLITAEILYHLPDHPKLLQSFVWQAFDLSPRYPVLMRFLSFWQANLEGKLHSVRVGTTGIIPASEIRYADVQLSVN